MSKLIVCAGERLEEGWMTHDVQDLPSIDIQCDFFDLQKYVDEASMEALQFTHALEHFPIEQSVTVLHSLWKLLEDKGTLYIEVPNLYWNAEEIVRNPRSRKNIGYIFGGQLNGWDFHYNGYTPETLAEDLREAGFDILELRPYSSIECLAVKNG